VHRINFGRPSPALVIALVALFVSLGGTGYAASQGTGAGASKAKTAAKPVTKAQVNKMIAGYLTAHRAELQGATGPGGAAGKNGDAGAKGDAGGKGDQGEKGDTGDKGDSGDQGDKGDTGDKGERGEAGPQGPGAISLVYSGSPVQGPKQLATVGPWTFTLTCEPIGTNSTLTINGPGELTQSVSTGSVPTLTNTPIGAGQTLQVNIGQHLVETGFLTSGTTTYQLDIQMRAEFPSPFLSCPVVGDAIPVS
jgi:Collagen triple helix repeat (20 copies)